MAKYRRRKYTWFPVIPTALGEETPGATWYDSVFNVASVSDPGTIFQQALNIVPDDTVDADEVTDQTTLRDAVEGQEYVVERIVGRVWGALGQNDNVDVWTRGMIGIGIAVMPYEDNDTIALNDASINPLGASNSDGSWLYRGVWPMFNNLASANALGVLGPTSIGNCGPDYGFVDTRSVRRIHRNERLTIVCAVDIMSLIGEEDALIRGCWGYDLRVLGQMRKAVGQSTYT